MPISEGRGQCSVSTNMLSHERVLHFRVARTLKMNTELVGFDNFLK